MRKKLFVSLTTLAMALVIAGCSTGQDNSGRAIKMQRSSGKMNREVDAGYYAVCKIITADGHSAEWVGPLRTDKERAMRDANDHNKQFPGHEAIITHN